MKTTLEIAQRYLGKICKCVLSREPYSDIVGVLLEASEDGQFRVRREDGVIHYCWPLLDIELCEWRHDFHSD